MFGAKLTSKKGEGSRGSSKLGRSHAGRFVVSVPPVTHGSLFPASASHAEGDVFNSIFRDGNNKFANMGCTFLP